MQTSIIKILKTWFSKQTLPRFSIKQTRRITKHIFYEEQFKYSHYFFVVVFTFVEVTVNDAMSCIEIHVS